MKKTNAFAALLLSLLILAACGKNAAEAEPQDQVQAQPDPGQVQTQPEEPETERPYYDTKGADYGGASFGIWNFDNVTATGWIGIPFDLFVDELTGDVLNDAVYERNLDVEKRLNISSDGTNVAEDFTPALQKMTAAGDTGVDLVFPMQYYVPSMISKSFVYSVQSVEAFDFAEPWWNQNCNDTLTVRGKLFTVASDASYFDKLATIVVFYNQQLAADYGIGDMYATVEEGGWTLDRMIELGEKVTADLDGNGI